MHNSSKGGFEHHGDAGAYSNNDHDPVQVSNQTQQVAANNTQDNHYTDATSALSLLFCLPHSSVLSCKK